MMLHKKSSLFLIVLQCCTVVIFSCNNDKANHREINSFSKDSLPNQEAANPYATHDQSPMDMSYYPPDYPVLRMNGADSGVLLARVIYIYPSTL